MKKNKLPAAPPYPIRFDAVTYLKIRYIAEIEARSINKQIELATKRMIADYETSNGVIDVDLDDLNE